MTGQSPPANATAVSQGISVKAVFSEAIQAATLSMVLRNSSNQVVTTLVSYDPDTRTATLDPDDELAGSQTFSVTVSGARDPAGNLMVPVSWSFTTGTEGFQDIPLPQTGLVNPTVIQFASDGRVFVAEKSGRIFVYDNLDDSSPDLVADLRVSVYNFWDRGLLGMALHPNFPATPSLYVLYAYDAAPGFPPPRWGVIPPQMGDPCPSPPGALGDGCVVTGRLTRLDLGNPGGWPLGPADEAPLITDWFQQFPSHSVGSLVFGPDGALYASGGEGASFVFADYGQIAANPSPDDPPGEGGSLRAQDLRTAGDPVALSGTIIRVDPNTGLALPDNPGYLGTSDPNGQRIVAYGLRNPLRITFRPGTSELWAGDVGWSDWEEINRLADPVAGPVANFGWPCYEGDGIQGGYDGLDLPLCEALYAEGSGAVVAPHYTYEHAQPVVPGEACSPGSSSISGLAFSPTSGGTYPGSYQGALFFADYSRNCIWAMRVGGAGLPNPASLTTIKSGAGGPVDLVVGPGGDIFYPGFDDGLLHRIQYFAGNLPPSASLLAAPTSGSTPLVVSFDGTGSTDPEGQSLAYAWDLDADGSFDDSSSATPQWTYNGSGTVIARLRVTDSGGLFDVAAVPISVNNSAPVAIIDTPGALTWRVGDTIAFTGRGTDADEPSGLLPATALHWDLVMHHCPSNCHTHNIQTFAGVAGGSFAAPDHEYPSYLELRLSVADPEGVPSTASVLLHPQTVAVTLQSVPSGLTVAMNAVNLATPFTRTVIVGSTNSIGASSPQRLGGLPRQFSSWSDGGAQNHIVVAPATPATYTASFVVPPVPAEVCGDGLDNDGDGVVDGGCGPNHTPAPPGAPVRLTSRVQGSTVTLDWSAPITGGSPTVYVLEAGLAPGQAAYQVPLGLLTSVRVPNVAPGKYYARVRAMNAAGASVVSNEVAATVGCTRPGPPTLTSAVNGGLVRLVWTDPDGCSGTTYRILAGTQPGAANLGELAVGDSVFTTLAPPGTYYLRVVAQTPLGTSDPSNEVTLAVGSGCTPPTLDSILGATLTGSQVTLRWNPVAPSAALAADAVWPIAYRLEVGSAAGAANLFVVPVGRTTSTTAAAPTGVYYARVRATDACGAGPPSNDVVISVP